MKREEFRHFFKLSVRWGDTDQLGHINNTEFLRYLECGRVDYCEKALGFLYTNDLTEGWILADIQCRFIDQLIYPSDIEIGSRLSRIGNSSAEMLAAIYRTGEPEPVATSKAIVVWFDFIEQNNKRVPEVIREKIKRFEVIQPV